MVARKGKSLNFTPQRLAALKLYASGEALNETALRIHGKTYSWLSDNGFIKRKHFLLSCITDKGREALKENA